MSALRWGILSAANIARKNWKAICNSGNGVVTAVASRDRKRSQQFISECQTQAPFPSVPQAFGSYEELLASPQVDAVYVPVPTGLRKEWVIRAAQAGKHVICEKPCGVTAGDVRQMLDACKANRVQFMDGVMFMHSQRLARMREVLDDGESIGEIKRIATQFTFSGHDEFFRSNIRLHSELEPLGCLGDLGWYNIRIILWALKWKMPSQVTGRILSAAGRKDSPSSVNTDFSGELFYEDGVSAAFYCSFLAENQQWAYISGMRGYMHVADFVLPFFGSETSFDVSSPFFRVEGCDFNMEPRTRRILVQEYSNSTTDSQETCMFRNFNRQVLSKQLEESWPEIALKTQQVMDACVASAKAKGQAVEVQS